VAASADLPDPRPAHYPWEAAGRGTRVGRGDDPPVGRRVGAAFRAVLAAACGTDVAAPVRARRPESSPRASAWRPLPFAHASSTDPPPRDRRGSG